MRTLSVMRYYLLGVVTLLLTVAISSTLASHKRALTEYKDTCGLYWHEIDVKSEDGCTGQLPVLSCHGRCQSISKPKFYTSR